MNNTWFHGTIYDFNEFDLNELGKSTNSKDAQFGFYFGRNQKTAEAYLSSGQEINEDMFLKKYNSSIKNVQNIIENLEEDFKVKYKIPYSEIKDSYSKKFKLTREFPELRDDLEKINKHYNIINPYSYDENSEIVDNYLLGNILEVEIQNDNFFHHDMENEPWNETKQLYIAKEAKLNGYDGVVFENMQDSGWFGGNGVDDILLKFDVKNILTKGIHEYRKEGVTFNDMKQKNKTKIKPT